MLCLVHLNIRVKSCPLFIVILSLAQNTASVDMRNSDRRVKRIKIRTLAILGSTAVWTNHAFVVPFESSLLKMLFIQNISLYIGISAPNISIGSYTYHLVANLRFVILYCFAAFYIVEILRL